MVNFMAQPHYFQEINPVPTEQEEAWALEPVLGKFYVHVIVHCDEFPCNKTN
jgi:hypothetical protein